MIISDCHALTSASFSNSLTVTIRYTINTWINVPKYYLHCKLVEISCILFVYIINETVNIINYWQVKAYRSLTLILLALKNVCPYENCHFPMPAPVFFCVFPCASLSAPVHSPFMHVPCNHLSATVHIHPLCATVSPCHSLYTRTIPC